MSCSGRTINRDISETVVTCRCARCREPFRCRKKKRRKPPNRICSHMLHLHAAQRGLGLPMLALTSWRVCECMNGHSSVRRIESRGAVFNRMFETGNKSRKSSVSNWSRSKPVQSTASYCSMSPKTPSSSSSSIISMSVECSTLAYLAGSGGTGGMPLELP